MLRSGDEKPRALSTQFPHGSSWKKWSGFKLQPENHQAQAHAHTSQTVQNEVNGEVI